MHSSTPLISSNLRGDMSTELGSFVHLGASSFPLKLHKRRGYWQGVAGVLHSIILSANLVSS